MAAILTVRYRRQVSELLLRNDPKITINIALIAIMARSKVCATSLSKVSRILILTMLQQH